jgi:hypothetical protein
MNIYTTLCVDLREIVDAHLDNHIYVEMQRPFQSRCISHLTKVFSYMRGSDIWGEEPMRISEEFAVFMGRSAASFPSRIEIDIFLYNNMFGGAMVRGKGFYPDKTLLNLACMDGPIIGMDECRKFEERIMKRHVRKSYVGACFEVS